MHGRILVKDPHEHVLAIDCRDTFSRTSRLCGLLLRTFCRMPIVLQTLILRLFDFAGCGASSQVINFVTLAENQRREVIYNVG